MTFFAYPVAMQRPRFWIWVLSPIVLIAGALMAKTLQRVDMPQPLRLLPDAPAIIYFDLRPLRQAGVFNKPVAYDPSYAQFIRQTGFNWERNVDQVALGLQPAAGVSRATLVLTGRFPSRLHAWIRQHARRTWMLHGQHFFEIQGLHRPLILTWLGSSELALSNRPAPASLTPLLRRWHRLLPAPAPALLSDLSWTARRQDFFLAAVRPSAWPASLRRQQPGLNLFQHARRLRLSARSTPHGPKLSLLVQSATAEQARNLAAELATLQQIFLNSGGPSPSERTLSGPQARSAAPAPDRALAAMDPRLRALLTGITVQHAGDRVWLRLVVPKRDLLAWFNTRHFRLMSRSIGMNPPLRAQPRRKAPRKPRRQH